MFTVTLFPTWYVDFNLAAAAKKRKISPVSASPPPPPATSAAKPLTFLNASSKPLPGFTKKKGGPIAEPSSQLTSSSTPQIDPFSEAMKHLGKPKTPPVTTSGSATVLNHSGLPNQFRKRKRVSWAPDGDLERIKVVERISYGDDEEGEVRHSKVPRVFLGRRELIPSALVL
jgi:hypothetical protein